MDSILQYRMKVAARQSLTSIGLKVSRVRRGSDGLPIYNPFDATINDYLKQIGGAGKFCVDIAAVDGKTASNTYSLFRQDWKGLAVEAYVQQVATLSHSYSNFPVVQLYRCFVTSPNVLHLLRTAETPERFGFLNLDIDGYDHDVLDEIRYCSPSAIRPHIGTRAVRATVRA